MSIKSFESSSSSLVREIIPGDAMEPRAGPSWANERYVVREHDPRFARGNFYAPDSDSDSDDEIVEVVPSRDAVGAPVVLEEGPMGLEVLEEIENFLQEEMVVDDFLQEEMVVDDGDDGGFMRELLLNPPENLADVEGDSGIGSITSDMETIPDPHRERPLNVRQIIVHDPAFGEDGIPILVEPAYSEQVSDTEDYHPVEDLDREVRLHRLLGIKTNFYKSVRVVNRLVQREEFRRIKSDLKRLRSRRINFRRVHPAPRRTPRSPGVDRPIRNRDICYGCGKRFWAEQIRRWIRCESCGLWLCPDCGTNPVHCQNEGDFL